jgi:hypothetical protein
MGNMHNTHATEITQFAEQFRTENLDTLSDDEYDALVDSITMNHDDNTNTYNMQKKLLARYVLLSEAIRKNNTDDDIVADIHWRMQKPILYNLPRTITCMNLKALSQVDAAMGKIVA